MDNGCLRESYLNVWTEAGTRQRSSYSSAEINAVNWQALKRDSGKVKRFIRNKLTVAKIDNVPILINAFSDFEAQKFSLWRGEVIGPRSKYIHRLV